MAGEREGGFDDVRPEAGQPEPADAVGLHGGAGVVRAEEPDVDIDDPAADRALSRPWRSVPDDLEERVRRRNAGGPA